MPQANYEKSWELAFNECVLGLEGTDVTVNDLYQALHVSRGDLRKQKRAFLTCIGDRAWRWNLYEDSDLDSPDYDEMAKTFVEHLETTANSLFRRDQLLGLTAVRPFWKFRALSYFSPSDCVALDGTIHPFTDNFWTTHLPPCGRVPCKCYVEALNQRDIQRGAP
jgi:hypothetical protein